MGSEYSFFLSQLNSCFQHWLLIILLIILIKKNKQVWFTKHLSYCLCWFVKMFLSHLTSNAKLRNIQKWKYHRQHNHRCSINHSGTMFSLNKTTTKTGWLVGGWFRISKNTCSLIFYQWTNGLITKLCQRKLKCEVLKLRGFRGAVNTIMHPVSV